MWEVTHEGKGGQRLRMGTPQHLEATGGGGEDTWRELTGVGSISQEESLSGRRPMGSTQITK